ncbi:hypothetical protein MS3_00000673 [Schistosoma haematobium]|uniref:Uncharacterized protein n=1 Tax=Schistosoma haematobium TaxID=6185 RepID=A0A922III0_SCHHA|nr:hypothetical protein MS3_00000673 [Schistosoma haematobium]KAH9580315.1 hypothetical protein MS3_00000673 [Schistosoma haematobium]
MVVLNRTGSHNRRKYACLKNNGYDARLQLDTASEMTLIRSNLNETVAIVYDTPSGPVMLILKTCFVVGSNSIIPETQCISNELRSSQKDGALLNARETVSVSTHEEKQKINQAA